MSIQEPYLFFAKIVWQVGNHDLGGGWNTVLWWTALLGGARSTGLLWVSRVTFVGISGDVGQRKRVLGKVGAFSTGIFLSIGQ